MRLSGRGAEVSAEERFSALFDMHYTALRSFVARRSPDENVVEEIVSETFIVAWRRLDAIPTHEPDAELSWLIRVALYTRLNAERSRRRRDALTDRLTHELRVRSNGDGTTVEIDDDLDTFVTAFKALAKDDRSVLLLSAWEGLSSSQLAVVFGCSTSAAGMRLSRARQRLIDAVAVAQEGIS